MNILNLTQHEGSVEQLATGLVEPNAYDKAYVKELLTLNNIPNERTLQEVCEARANLLVEIMEKANSEQGIENFLVAGHPLLLKMLQLKNKGRYFLLGAHSDRVSIEDKDGNKVSRFKHMFFYSLQDGSDIDYMDMPTVIL